MGYFWLRRSAIVGAVGFSGAPGKELILVENLENFLARDKVFPYLRDHCGVAMAKIATDIAYAAGNAITKSCNTAWLTAYESAL